MVAHADGRTVYQVAQEQEKIRRGLAGMMSFAGKRIDEAQVSPGGRKMRFYAPGLFGQ
jgi:hypothetical protein